MRSIFLHLGVFFVCLVFTGTMGHAASAQENINVPDMAATAVPKEDIPDEYLEEANAFFDQCSSDYSMGQYYNCECLSVAYLDRRIDKGPIESASSIKQSLSHECRDAVGAAGPVYQNCIRKANRFKPGTDPEKYCECVANNYVKSIDRATPSIDSRSIVAYQVAAYGSCDNQQDRR